VPRSAGRTRSRADAAIDQLLGGVPWSGHLSGFPCSGPNPRFKVTVKTPGWLQSPETRKVSRAQNSPARISNRRGSVALMRIDPTTLPAYRATNTCDGPGPASWLPHRPEPQRIFGYCGPAHTSRSTGRTLLSGQTTLEGTNNEATLRPQDTLPVIAFSANLSSAFDPTRAVARTGTQNSTPGSHSSPTSRRPATTLATMRDGRPDNCVRRLMVRLTVTPRVSTGAVSLRPDAGHRSGILNASNAVSSSGCGSIAHGVLGGEVDQLAGGVL